MARLSTRDLILDVAIVLLNERGESVVTSVDLATEMNISPGNLYYHFKGKEEIIEELYAQFHARLLLVLQEITATANGDSKQTLAALCVVSDILQQFKFISHDITGIHERYPSLRRSLSRMMTLLHQSLLALTKLVLEKYKVSNIPKSARLLADNLMYTLINYDAYASLINTEQPSETTSIEEHLYLHFLPFIESD